jgi:hypothetical protein
MDQLKEKESMQREEEQKEFPVEDVEWEDISDDDELGEGCFEGML